MVISWLFSYCLITAGNTFVLQCHLKLGRKVTVWFSRQNLIFLISEIKENVTYYRQNVENLTYHHRAMKKNRFNLTPQRL